MATPIWAVGSGADGVRSRSFREVGSLVYPRALLVGADEKRRSVLEIGLYVDFGIYWILGGRI
jgi:hypothetical protein